MEPTTKEEMDVVLANNKLIGQFMGIEPEEEYYIGTEGASRYSPRHTGYFPTPYLQKKECERYISEYRPKGWLPDEYGIMMQEWWPWYNQDWNKLMEVIERLDLWRDSAGNLICRTTATSHTFYIEYYKFGIGLSPDYKHGRHRAEGESRIWNVYLAIIDFINWYNSTKQ